MNLHPKSGAVVVYLPSANVHSREGDVERINSFAFYDVGKAFRQVEAFEGDVPAGAALLPLMDAQRAIGRLLEGKPIPLGVSRAKAETFNDQIKRIFEQHFEEVTPDGKRQFKFPDAGAPPVEAWKLYWVKKALAEFETVFAEEMRETATYFVPRRGIYSTPALVDRADDTFPADLLPCFPQKTRDDWRSAGRCLAFNLLSASGFHVTRAVEGMMEAYYQLFVGQPGKTLHNWNDYIQELEVLAKTKPTPCPASKTLAELRQMKDDYRNPIAHPRVVLGEADARMLFANGESLIIAMAQEIAAVRGTQGGLQNALALVQPTPAIAAPATGP